MADKTLLDAVNASLEAPPKEPEADPKPEAGEGEPESDKPEDGSVPEGTPEGETEPEKKPEGDADDGEKPEGEKPEGEKEPEKKPEAAAEPEKKPEEKKPVDHINDPIPPQVSERTRERITSLVATVKDQAAKIERANETFNIVASTGVTPENFASTIEYLRLFNSENVDDRKKALRFLMGEARALALELGETPPGVDPLEGHEDLVNAVAAQSITQQHAVELANARNQRKLQETRQQRTNQETQEWNAARETARATLNDLGATLKDTDPLYEQKAAIVVPLVNEFAKTAHPSKWAAEFQRRYREVKLPAAPAAPTAKPNGQQPLRANKQPSGDGKKQPTSMLEAVSSAVAK